MLPSANSTVSLVSTGICAVWGAPAAAALLPPVDAEAGLGPELQETNSAVRILNMTIIFLMSLLLYYNYRYNAI
jgi:hypothetical protein